MSQVQKLIHGGALRLMIIFLVTHCTVMRKNKKQVAAQGSIPNPTDAVVLNKQCKSELLCFIPLQILLPKHCLLSLDYSSASGQVVLCLYPCNDCIILPSVLS